ncbi:MAG TPA: DUF427 domain-containing protein [Pseudohaliea sp.]|nr:DUF427 domain-containing protein [Pseudohaliea sp.]
MWHYRGQGRPPFAQEPGPGQESVWDYPRPPVPAPDGRRVRVLHGEQCLCDSRAAVRVLETASPPTWYLPPDDCELAGLVPVSGGSFCEWKGRASYFALRDAPQLGAVAWCYAEPSAAFAGIAGFLSFYPGKVACFVDGERVKPQPGGFYGGWMTSDIVGPVKGETGTGGW